MIKSQIIIEQIICCNSYAEAIEISKAFGGFHFRIIGLGRVQTVYAKRFISKLTTSNRYKYCVKIRFTINYQGEFLSYGYLDERSKKKYPELSSLLSEEEVDRRWKIVSKFQNYEDDLCRDIYFYEDFKDFFDEVLKEYLNKIYLTEVIAFADCYCMDTFIVFYQEQGVTYEIGYSATSPNKSVYAEKYVPACELEPIHVRSVWNWTNKNYYSKKDDYISEARPLTAISYVVNRLPFEQLLYAVIGLESVYTKDEHRVKKQLKEIIPKVFSFISEEDVEVFYKLRSEFVHGDIIFPIFYDNNVLGSSSINYWEPAQKASALLLLTVRLLVKYDATKIQLDQTGNVIFVKGKTFSEYFNA